MDFFCYKSDKNMGGGGGNMQKMASGAELGVSKITKRFGGCKVARFFTQIRG